MATVTTQNPLTNSVQVSLMGTGKKRVNSSEAKLFNTKDSYMFLLTGIKHFVLFPYVSLSILELAL